MKNIKEYQVKNKLKHLATKLLIQLKKWEQDGDAFASDWGEDNWIADYLADNSLRKEKDGKKGI